MVMTGRFDHSAGDIADSATGCPLWIPGPSGTVYAVLHSPERRASTAVLIVPPFGWDEVESHRARWYWAVRLAAEGLPCLRVDLPGTGDSEGGPRDSDLFDRWTRCVETATAWLRAATGVNRVAVIGIGLGGLIACRALSEGAAIDDLILWATRASGRHSVRELRAYAGMVASQHPADHAGHEVEDGVGVTGFLFTNETLSALAACNVADMDFSHVRPPRVLLLSRDTLSIDPALQHTFGRIGAAVTNVQTRDYAHLMAHPQSLVLRRPESTVALSIDWLREGHPKPPPHPSSASASASGTVEGRPEFSLHPDAVRSAEIRDGHRVVRETIVDIDVGGCRGYAIVTEPTAGERAPVSALLLSPGAIRKIGQHRMWVELARRWAARGVPSVRFDLPGIGDTSGPADAGADESATVHPAMLSSPETMKAVGVVLEQLRRRGIGDQFVTVGHCSGAYIGFHMAIADPGVLACFSVDQQIFEYSEAAYQSQMLKMIGGALRGGLIRRLRTRGVTAHEIAQVRRAVAYRLANGRAGGLGQTNQSPDRMLDGLRDRGTDMLMLLVQEAELSGRMPEGDYASWTARWPNLAIEELPTKDHMARALWLQQLTHDRLDAALERLLQKLTVDGVPSAAA